MSIDGPTEERERTNARLQDRLQQRLTRLPHAKSDLIRVLASAFNGTAEPQPTPGTVGGAAPAYLIWTSGTTAAPKLISTLHRSVVNFLGWYIEQFRIHANDRFALLSGLAHDPVIRDVFTPLSVGASLHIPSEGQRVSPGMLIEWLQEAKPTIVHLPPMLESSDQQARDRARDIGTSPGLRRRTPHIQTRSHRASGISRS